MAIELRDDAGTWVLRLSGAIDIRDAMSLLMAAREAAQGGQQGIVVHLRDVDRLDTSATQILLSLHRHCAASGRAFRLAGTPPPVAELWRRTALLDFIAPRVFDEPGDAIPT
jgi:anti-anti-sigma factor